MVLLTTVLDVIDALPMGRWFYVADTLWTWIGSYWMLLFIVAVLGVRYRNPGYHSIAGLLLVIWQQAHAIVDLAVLRF